MKLEQIFFVKEAVTFILRKQDIFVKEVVSFLKKLLVSRKHVTSDDIARYVRQILAEDEYHRMKPTEVAKEVVAIITGSPTRKKRRPSSKAPLSKNICDYISNT